ncbi:MAG: N-formylglutamate deformylase [Caldimonas sp.]
MSEPVFTLQRGSTPLLVSLPHVGTVIPDALKPLYIERAFGLEDTDWHLESLYAIARELGAGLLVPRHSRYVIDLNRPPENTPMYVGANNTELCPTRFFSGEPLYRRPFDDADAEIARRRETYWRPYHEALEAELARLKREHGHAVLWDGHSIKSELPWLFDGRLADLNLGTAGGTSCAASLRDALSGVLARQTRFSHVTDGRFKGGHITRHFGRPEQRIHAVQLEMCWSCYMAEAPPYVVDPGRARQLQPVLRELLQTVLDWRPDA